MSRLTDNIDEACATHDIFDVLGTRKRTMVCPLPMHKHSNNTPSFSVFWKNKKQWWKCHGNCNQEGDIVDLIGFLRIPGYRWNNPADQEKALQLLDERYEMKYIPPELPKPSLYYNQWQEYLPYGDYVRLYAQRRGLNETTLQKFQIGQKGTFMSIPTFENGTLAGIKFRNTLPGKIRFNSETGSRVSLFNYDAVYLSTEPVLMVKGEIPAMLLDQMGYLVCAPTAGEGANREQMKIAVALSKLVIVGDNDAAGQKLGLARHRFFGGKLVFPPEKYKDIDDWILDDPSAGETIDKWINRT